MNKNRTQNYAELRLPRAARLPAMAFDKRSKIQQIRIVVDRADTRHHMSRGVVQ